MEYALPAFIIVVIGVALYIAFRPKHPKTGGGSGGRGGHDSNER